MSKNNDVSKVEVNDEVRTMEYEGEVWLNASDYARLVMGIAVKAVSKEVKEVKDKVVNEPVKAKAKAEVKVEPTVVKPKVKEVPAPVVKDEEEERPRVTSGIQPDPVAFDSSILDVYFKEVKRTKKSEDILREIYLSKSIGFEELWTKLGKNPPYLYQWDDAQFPCIKSEATKDGTVFTWVGK